MKETTIVDSAVAAADPVFFLSWEWWGEQIFVWAVFTVLVSVILNKLRDLRKAKEREPFEDWELVLIGDDDPKDPTDHQPLHWEEVRRITESDFERWKLVKSVVGGACRLNVTRIKPAEEAGWTYCEEKRLVIDFNKIPPEHMKTGTWDTPPKHLRADAKCPKPRPKPEALKESRAKQIYRRRKSLRTVRRVAPKKHYRPSKSVTERL